jgi:hypothetical protein
MNNIISCECLDCGNQFVIGVPDLLDVDQDAVIGDIAWCGTCDGHRYQCHWGLFVAGDSSDTIRNVLSIWRDWADSYRRSCINAHDRSH